MTPEAVVLREKGIFAEITFFPYRMSREKRIAVWRMEQEKWWTRTYNDILPEAIEERTKIVSMSYLELDGMQVEAVLNESNELFGQALARTRKLTLNQLALLMSHPETSERAIYDQCDKQILDDLIEKQKEFGVSCDEIDLARTTAWKIIRTRKDLPEDIKVMRDPKPSDDFSPYVYRSQK